MLAFGPQAAHQLELLDSDAELQKEVFTWPLEEDVWAGVLDDPLRTHLQERFTTEFQAMRPPEERNMDRFSDFIDEIGAALVPGSNDWSVAASGAAELSNTALMINGLLAFHNQLQWMLDMFRDLPGASVSVR